MKMISLKWWLNTTKETYVGIGNKSKSGGEEKHPEKVTSEWRLEAGIGIGWRARGGEKPGKGKGWEVRGGGKEKEKEKG